MPLRRTPRTATKQKRAAEPRNGGKAALPRLVIQRQSLRDELERTCEDLEEGLRQQDEEKLSAALGNLEEEYEILKEIEAKLNILWPIEELADYTQRSLEFAKGINLWRWKAGKALTELRQLSSRVNSNENLVAKEQVRVKLPKLEVPKFYGDLVHWISFWNIFESSIHNNNSLSNVDKFAYLKTHLGGTALSAIEGLLITSENYFSAIDILQERFGSKNKLIATHMNYLLAIPTLRNSNDVHSFRKLFDHLNAHMRSLEALGVPTDSYGSILQPLILKLLPEDLLVDFHKCQNTNCLGDLISFLSLQLSAREGALVYVNRESGINERRRIPVTSSNFQSGGNLKKSAKMGKEESGQKVPTASELLVTENSTAAEGKVCAFCNLTHEDSFCEYAQSVSMEERINILKRNGVCFKCCDKSARHLSRNCKEKVKCTFCSGSHNPNLCFSVEDYRHVETSADLSNQETPPVVYLQSLLIGISNGNIKKTVRAIIDTGSSRSYISRFAAETLKLKSTKEVSVTHGLFGGSKKSLKHKMYRSCLQSFDGSYSLEVDLMDQDKICENIPRLQEDVCKQELKQQGIFLSDISPKRRRCLYRRHDREIHVLLGSDIVGNLFTGEVKPLVCGLTAVGTKLGWTVIGEFGQKELDSSLLLPSLHTNTWTIKDLQAKAKQQVELKKIQKTSEEENSNLEKEFNHLKDNLKSSLEHEEILDWRKQKKRKNKRVRNPNSTRFMETKKDSVSNTTKRRRPSYSQQVHLRGETDDQRKNGLEEDSKSALATRKRKSVYKDLKLTKRTVKEKAEDTSENMSLLQKLCPLELRGSATRTERDIEFFDKSRTQGGECCENWTTSAQFEQVR